MAAIMVGHVIHRISLLGSGSENQEHKIPACTPHSVLADSRHDVWQGRSLGPIGHVRSVEPCKVGSHAWLCLVLSSEI
jgi:hypothetical protein